MKILTYLSKKHHSCGCSPLELQVYRYLNAIDVCRLAKNNPRISLPPVYRKLISDLHL